MKHMKEERDALIGIYAFGHLFLISDKYSNTFMSFNVLLMLVIWSVLNAYARKKICSHIWGVITGIVILFPVVMHVSNFNAYIYPMMIDGIIGLVMIVYSSFKLHVLYKSRQ